MAEADIWLSFTLIAYLSRKSNNETMGFPLRNFLKAIANARENVHFRYNYAYSFWITLTLCALGDVLLMDSQTRVFYLNSLG